MALNNEAEIEKTLAKTFSDLSATQRTLDSIQQRESHTLKLFLWFTGILFVVSGGIAAYNSSQLNASIRHNEIKLENAITAYNAVLDKKSDEITSVVERLTNTTEPERVSVYGVLGPQDRKIRMHFSIYRSKAQNIPAYAVQGRGSMFFETKGPPGRLLGTHLQPSGPYLDFITKGPGIKERPFVKMSAEAGHYHTIGDNGVGVQMTDFSPIQLHCRRQCVRI